MAHRSTTSVGTNSAQTPRASFELRECTDATEWEAFLQHRDQTLYHRWKWNSVFAAYGLPVRRFAAYEGGRIVGILPTVRQRSRLFGDQYVSLPWLDWTGVVTGAEGAAEALVHHVAQWVNQHPRTVLQVRQLEPLDTAAICRQDKVLMRLRLPTSAGDLWTALKAKVRNQIRKAERSGIEATIGGPELVDEFFDVYGRNMRDLGSPAHSPRFFHEICTAFSQEVRIAIARLRGMAVGAGFTLHNGTVLEIPWASSLRKYNALCVNHLLYWRLLSLAADEQYEWFHFGRSTPGSGTHQFKKQWGAEARQLYWYYYSSDTNRAQRLAQPPEDRFGLAQRIWSRLPLFLTNRLGPRFIAGIP